MSNTILDNSYFYITIHKFIGKVQDFESRMKYSSSKERQQHLTKCFDGLGQHLYATYVHSKNAMEFVNELDEENLMKFMCFDW